MLDGYEFMGDINIYMWIMMSIMTVLICLYGYIKVTFRFWSMQPVFHAYNVWYWVRPPGLIDMNLPQINKYVNKKEIKFYNMGVITDVEKRSVTKLIGGHYVKQKGVEYDPCVSGWMPYFKGHNVPCFLSTYISKDYLGKEEIIGTMTTRPLSVRLYGSKFNIYYVDYLCVHGGYRKKGIAPELIQTHNYYQCRANPKIMCSLFKKETDLTGIVPLTVYKTYCFDMKDWRHDFELHSSIQIVEVSKANMHMLGDFLKVVEKNKERYDCFIMPSMGNIQSLVETNNMYIFMAKQGEEILGVYFFRDSSLKYDDARVLECFCTLNNVIRMDLFVYMFSASLKRMRELLKDVRYLLLENVSDTKDILLNIRMKYSPMFESPTAYYFYNYGERPIQEFRVCIIN